LSNTTTTCIGLGMSPNFLAKNKERQLPKRCFHKSRNNTKSAIYEYLSVQKRAFLTVQTSAEYHATSWAPCGPQKIVSGPREFLKRINLYSVIRMKETCDSIHFADLIKFANRCLIFDGNRALLLGATSLVVILTVGKAVRGKTRYHP